MSGEIFDPTGLAMFETLFKYPAAITRHREVPLARERGSYLVHQPVRPQEYP